jgi:hypothetical protein
LVAMVLLLAGVQVHLLPQRVDLLLCDLRRSLAGCVPAAATMRMDNDPEPFAVRDPAKLQSPHTSS